MSSVSSSACTPWNQVFHVASDSCARTAAATFAHRSSAAGVPTLAAPRGCPQAYPQCAMCGVTPPGRAPRPGFSRPYCGEVPTYGSVRVAGVADHISAVDNATTGSRHRARALRRARAPLRNARVGASAGDCCVRRHGRTLALCSRAGVTVARPAPGLLSRPGRFEEAMREENVPAEQPQAEARSTASACGCARRQAERCCAAGGPRAVPACRPDLADS